MPLRTLEDIAAELAFIRKTLKQLPEFADKYSTEYALGLDDPSAHYPYKVGFLNAGITEATRRLTKVNQALGRLRKNLEG